MYCHKCGNKSPEDSEFCHKCGEKFGSQPLVGSSVNNDIIKSCIPLYVIRFIGVAILILIVIIQHFYLDLYQSTDLFNSVSIIVATGISCYLAISLLLACKSNTFDNQKVKMLVSRNRSYSGLCILFFLWEFFFSYGNNILILLIILEAATLVIALGILHKSFKSLV